MQGKSYGTIPETVHIKFKIKKLPLPRIGEKRIMQNSNETPVNFEIDGKRIAVFASETENAPTVYANMFSELGGEVLRECEKLGGKPFHLVSITGLQWDEELSPWAHAPIVSKDDNFTGGADKYILCLTEKIIPRAEEAIKAPSFRVIAGYSMGGLFALYAPYVTDAFSRAVSASGSAWYPGFVSFVRENDFLRKPDAIYLSLGDKESRTKNQYLSQTEASTKELYSIYQARQISSAFELNPGNHFKDAPLRLAKGINWILDAALR